MKKLLTLILLTLGTAATAQNVEINARAGYSVGGTVPMGFPEALRGLNSFAPKFNYRIGLDASYQWNRHWGILAGLYMEQKGFKSDVSLRQFDVILRQGVETITGPYTAMLSSTSARLV